MHHARFDWTAARPRVLGRWNRAGRGLFHPILLIPAALLVGSLIGALWIQPRTGPVLAPGTQLPDVSVSRFPGSNSVPLASYRGRPLLITFWATWCPPCRTELTALSAWSRARPNAFPILAINYQESPQEIAAFVEQQALPFDIASDPTGALARAFDVQAFPTSYLIDAEGRIVRTEVGYDPDLIRQLDAFLP